MTERSAPQAASRARRRKAAPRHTATAPPVRLEKSGAVACITLNRPHVHNAYDTRMRDALYEALLAVRDDPEVRAVILRGAGRSFCSGGDLREFGTAPSLVAAREARWRRDVCGLLASLPKATIAAVQGYAVGGGLELALLCDLCLLASNARLRYPETGLGMIPGLGGTQTTTHLARLGRAQELVLSGCWLTAREAVEWGLALACLPRPRLWPATQHLARQCATLSPALLAASKRVVWEGSELPLTTALDLERRLATRGFLASANVANKVAQRTEGRVLP